MTGVGGRDVAVRVRAEAEEGDVPEVEQAGEADGDVQAETEQRVEERDQAIAEEIALGGDEGKDHRRYDEHEQAPGRRSLVPAASHPADRPAIALTLVFD